MSLQFFVLASWCQIRMYPPLAFEIDKMAFIGCFGFMVVNRIKKHLFGLTQSNVLTTALISEGHCEYIRRCLLLQVFRHKLRTCVSSMQLWGLLPMNLAVGRFGKLSEINLHF